MATMPAASPCGLVDGSVKTLKIRTIVRPVPIRKMRGVRVVTNVGSECDGRSGSAGRAMPLRTVKSCGPGTPGLVLSL